MVKEERLFTEKEEEALLARDTRNIVLGGLMSMISSVTTLYIVQKYIVQKTAAAAIAQAQRMQMMAQSSYPQGTENWKPLSDEELQIIHITSNI